jgi:hypothetical protein
MTLRLNSSLLAATIALMMLPRGAFAGGTQRVAAVAPDQLVDMRDLLVGSERAEITLLSGATRVGTIASVSEDRIGLNTRPRRNRAAWQIETISTVQIRQVRLFHRPRRDWRTRVGRTLGVMAGLTAAGPIAYHAGASGREFLAWTAMISMPALGALAGERLAQRSQQTIIPVMRPADVPGSESVAPGARTLHVQSAIDR